VRKRGTYQYDSGTHAVHLFSRCTVLCRVAALSLMPSRGKGNRKRSAPTASAAGDEKTTAATAAADADGDVSMDSGRDGGGGGGGGGGGSGGGGGDGGGAGPSAAKRLTYASSSAALGAMLDALPGHRPGFLLPEINAIIGEYAAPEPLRWEVVPPPAGSSSSESKSAALPCASISADGLTAELFATDHRQPRVQTNLTLSECVSRGLRVRLTVQFGSELRIDRTIAEADEEEPLPRAGRLIGSHCKQRYVPTTLW
jgi:hypothetical protein